MLCVYIDLSAAVKSSIIIFYFSGGGEMEEPEIFCCHLRGGPQKNHLDIGGGGRSEKTPEIFRFSPIPPPFINNERSLKSSTTLHVKVPTVHVVCISQWAP